MARLDPHSCADLEQGRTTHLDLRWTVDFAARVLRGSATLRFADAGEGRLDLDSRDLDVTAVEDQDGRSLAFSFGADEGFIGRPLTIVRLPGTTAITVRYTTSPKASALLWLDPEHTASGQHPFMLSQCQAIHARSIVPCQDSPLARVTYTAEIVVPKPLVAVMSAAPGEVGPGPDGATTTARFSMPQAIPTYLLALAVGEIAGRDLGPRTRVYAEPAVLDAAAFEFGEIEQMLAESEALFGPYMWDRYDFLVLPPAFPYGGMENPRLTFLTPTLIAGDRSLVCVLTHELAHSWTGNLVTNANMDHFWLNEGFTVWAERRVLERLWGEERLSLAAAIGLHGLREDLDRFGQDAAVTCLVNDLRGMDPDDVFSRVPYEKGFLLVTALERAVGREAWDHFVRDYIRRFAFTSITTPEFEAFLEERLPGVGAKVGMDRWLRQPGLPADFPVFPGERLGELQALAAGWAAGQRPGPEAGTWSTSEWLVWLQALPLALTPADCRWIDEAFGLTSTRNADILCQWLTTAIRSGHEPGVARAGEFLGSMGRMKFLKPLYQALVQSGRVVLARELFGKYAGRYHPIARGGIEAILAKA